MESRLHKDSMVEMIDAYETILYNERKGEKSILNRQRFKEYERNRPPADKWFELKSTDF